MALPTIEQNYHQMIITLRKINTSDSIYCKAENLFLEAFPSNERRDISDQRHNIDENPLFNLFAIEKDAEFVGILSAWQFKDFRYIEHFAILPEQRSAGIGAKALQQYINMCDLPIILEVENPDEAIKIRRISFYKRQGLALWDNVHYFQPPYREGDKITPMKLMATKNLKPEIDYIMVKSQIYNHVYKYLEGKGE